MPDFHLVSDFQPQGDQPEAIAQLVQGIERGDKSQVLLGVSWTAGRWKRAGAWTSAILREPAETPEGP